ncbi:hypothetical protein BOTCAL_0031g00460 [Botryotinia calthae]|uniref:Uncharacterized protein n=1 Tax=Botryotinia calthae TaxID=38488 RepID=A0A4Y8DD87_9HELO|nr:hypothetical protein BOTCAL_0031g00460 [Botryotinia calthae]
MWGSLETSNAEDSLAAAVGWWLGEKILVAIATKNANYPMRRWLRFKIARNDRSPWEFQERIHVKPSYIASVLPKFSLIWGLLSIPTTTILQLSLRTAQQISRQFCLASITPKYIRPIRIKVTPYFLLEAAEMSSILVKACSMMGKLE